MMTALGVLLAAAALPGRAQVLPLSSDAAWAKSLGGVEAQVLEAHDQDEEGRKIPKLPDGPDISKQDVDTSNDSSNAVLHEQAMAPKVLPDGTKEYDLTASAFPWELFPGARVTVWGYNGQVPGPLMRWRVGDKVKIVVTNKLPQATTVHWHGLAVPNSQDGVPGTTQKPIPPGGTFTYVFTVTSQMVGTHYYHTHFNDDFQMDMGLHGPLIIDPAGGPGSDDVDALYELSGFKFAGSDEENVFGMDGKAFPDAPALQVPLGARVRIRLINASARETHVMHLHGYTFQIVALDGNPAASPQSADTVSLGPSQTADIEFTANNPGAWMFHCHILDHTINPGPAGAGSATEPASMGGLVSFVDVVSGPVASGYLSAGSFMMDGMPMSMPMSMDNRP